MARIRGSMHRFDGRFEPEDVMPHALSQCEDVMASEDVMPFFSLKT